MRREEKDDKNEGKKLRGKRTSESTMKTKKKKGEHEEEKNNNNNRSKKDKTNGNPKELYMYKKRAKDLNHNDN